MIYRLTLTLALLILSNIALSNDADSNDKYISLYEKIKEINTEKCVKVSSESLIKKKNLESLKSFLSSTDFSSIKKGLPAKISISEEYYTPQGKNILIEKKEIVIEKKRAMIFVLSESTNGLNIMAASVLFPEKDMYACVGSVFARVKHH